LHALIDWSYELLNDQERSVLRQLAVFAGGWTLEAAGVVCLLGDACTNVLTELVDHSLVAFGTDAGHQRYTMHETIRQFALEQLRGSEQEAGARERHARYYAELVSGAAENRTGQPFAERLRTVVDDHDNVGRAFEWLLVHDGEQALALVAQLGALNFWELGGFFQEGRRWLQRVLENTRESVSLQRGHALLAASNLSSAITDFEYGLQCVQQARQLFQQLGDQRGEIDAQLKYCILAELVGETADLQAQVEEALHMAEQFSYTVGIARAKRVLATILKNTTGETEVAIQYDLASVALWREVQDPSELAVALNNLGADLMEVHEFAAARQALLECQEIYQSLGYQRGVALALHNLGETAHRMGDYVRARELLRESLRIRRHLGLPRGYPYSFEILAQVNESEGRYEQAVQLLAASDTLRGRIGAPLELVAQKYVTAVLTSARAQLGDVAFELAWSKGAAMTTEQAIALALS
jgi:tetratricopeptide (TPR) repeat protein